MTGWKFCCHKSSHYFIFSTEEVRPFPQLTLAYSAFARAWTRPVAAATLLSRRVVFPHHVLRTTVTVLRAMVQRTETGSSSSLGFLRVFIIIKLRLAHGLLPFPNAWDGLQEVFVCVDVRVGEPYAQLLWCLAMSWTFTLQNVNFRQFRQFSWT